jgi:hypothetical protein
MPDVGACDFPSRERELLYDSAVLHVSYDSGVFSIIVFVVLLCAPPAGGSSKPTSTSGLKIRTRMIFDDKTVNDDDALLPVQSSTYDAAILVFNTNTIEVVQYLDISPWKKA